MLSLNRTAAAAVAGISALLLGLMPLASPRTTALSPQAVVAACSPALQDQAFSGNCLTASSEPQLGQLYPLSDAFNVSPVGNVGVGTANPEATLEIIGNFPQQLSGTLTIPQGAQKILGVGAMFLAELSAGDLIRLDQEVFEVAQVQNDSLVTVMQSATSDHFNVSGFTQSARLRIRDGQGASEVVVDRAGNVGIGVDAPTAKLDVDGPISGFGIVPVGTISPWHKSLTATPTLADGWAECNGQIIQDPGSVYNGVQLPNLNGEGRFLRGGATSGVLQEHMFQDHEHFIKMNGENYASAQMGKWNWSAAQSSSGAAGSQVTVGIGPARSGNAGVETRPINMSVVWIIRIK